MKLNIDFDNKIIKLNDSVNLGELVDKLNEVIPNWKEFTLEASSYTYTPIISPNNPWIQPNTYRITCTDNGFISC